MNEDVAEKIATFIEKDNVPYKLLKWIDPQKLNKFLFKKNRIDP